MKRRRTRFRCQCRNPVYQRNVGLPSMSKWLQCNKINEVSKSVISGIFSVGMLLLLLQIYASSVCTLLQLLISALATSTPLMFTPVISKLLWSSFESSMIFPDLLVDSMNLYFLHASASWCNVSMTSLGLGSTIQLLHVLRVYEFRLKK